MKNIQITSFRNFSRLNLDFSPTLNVFEGGNSQGKTNLLEAIYCVSRGSSFRTYGDQNLIKWDEGGFYLGAEGEKRGSSFRFEVSLAKNSTKVRLVNSHRAPLKDINHWLWTIAFSTQDMKIVQEGPYYRRDFLDEVAGFIYSNFSYLRYSYGKVLSQRNTLFNRIKEQKKDYQRQMLGWNSQLVKLGSEIVYLRLKVLEKLAKNLSRIYPRLRGRECRVHLAYNSSFLRSGEGSFSFKNIKQKFQTKLSAVKHKEIERGVSLVGPHRDDFQVSIDGVDQRTFGSQGEQRALAASLRLAEVDVIAQIEGDSPIVLLDDVPADLDPNHEKYLLRTIREKGQIFVATQDVEKFDRDFLKDSLIFHIKNGDVISDDAR